MDVATTPCLVSDGNCASLATSATNMVGAAGTRTNWYDASHSVDSKTCASGVITVEGTLIIRNHARIKADRILVTSTGSLI